MTGLFKSLKAVVISVPFLLGGAALVIVVFFELPMYIFLSLQFLTLFILFYVAYEKKNGNTHKNLIRRIKTGFYAGILGTAGYDIIRLLIVTIFHFKIRPFDTFKFFGQIILDHPVNESTAYVVGFLYHLLNGITFAIAFFILFRNGHWGYGILWAFLLEMAMLAVYPRFLNVQSFMEEFTIVSCSGHTVYGTILGLINYYKFKNLKIIRYVTT